MRSGKSWSLAFAAVAALGLMLSGGNGAHAQSGVTTALPAVQQCLCAQRALSVYDRRRQAAQRRNERAHGDLDALTHQVEDARARVNTDNRADIVAFKALLRRRDALAEQVRQEDERYAAIVARYNQAASDNNAACTGRLFDPEEVESVKATLACPRLDR